MVKSNNPSLTSDDSSFPSTITATMLSSTTSSEKISNPQLNTSVVNIRDDEQTQEDQLIAMIPLPSLSIKLKQQQTSPSSRVRQQQQGLIRGISNSEMIISLPSIKTRRESFLQQSIIAATESAVARGVNGSFSLSNGSIDFTNNHHHHHPQLAAATSFSSSAATAVPILPIPTAEIQDDELAAQEYLRMITLQAQQRLSSPSDRIHNNNNTSSMKTESSTTFSSSKNGFMKNNSLENIDTTIYYNPKQLLKQKQLKQSREMSYDELQSCFQQQEIQLHSTSKEGGGDSSASPRPNSAGKKLSPRWLLEPLPLTNNNHHNNHNNHNDNTSIINTTTTSSSTFSAKQAHFPPPSSMKVMLPTILSESSMSTRIASSHQPTTSSSSKLVNATSSSNSKKNKLLQVTVIGIEPSSLYPSPLHATATTEVTKELEEEKEEEKEREKEEGGQEEKKNSSYNTQTMMMMASQSSPALPSVIPQKKLLPALLDSSTLEEKYESQQQQDVSEMTTAAQQEPRLQEGVGGGENDDDNASTPPIHGQPTAVGNSNKSGMKEAAATVLADPSQGQSGKGSPVAIAASTSDYRLI